MIYAVILIGLALALVGAFGAASPWILLICLVVGLVYGLRHWGKAPEWTTCPYCLNAVRTGATRCQHCHARIRT